MQKPKRKHPRLKEYDYSRCGYYYITVQKQFDAPVFSRVGRGLAPAATIELTKIGMEIECQLLDLENRYSNVIIDKYIIMPTHIHAIIILTETAAGASPRPTLCSVVGVWKSLATRACNEKDGTPGRKIFQTSFYDSVLDTEEGYFEAWQYIDENPAKWALGEDYDRTR